MSSAVVSTSAALGRPFLFDAEPEPEMSMAAAKKSASQPLIPQVLPSTSKQASTIIAFGNRHSILEYAILPASRLEARPAPEMVTSGIPHLDALTGGLPRGCLTEIYGPASSGRTSVMLAALAAATRRGEYCALIDASDALDPHAIAASGVDLDRMLWIRCSENSPPRHTETNPRNGTGKVESTATLSTKGHRFHNSQIGKQSEHRLEQVLRATDLLLESGGFGLILLDLADIPYQSARRISMTTWFRFRRAVEHKPTILLAIEQQPIAGSCSSLLLRLGSQPISERTKPSRSSNSNPNPACDRPIAPHAQLLTELTIRVELVRSRLDRKPARSVAFETKTAWAG